MAKDMINIDVQGYEKTMRELKRLPDKLKRPAMLAIAKLHGKKIKEDAKRNADNLNGTGNLADSIVMRASRKRGKKHGIWIGPGYGSKRKYDGFYGPFVERGTRRSAAKPFMRPAYEKNKIFVSAGMGKSVRKIVNKQASKTFWGSRL